MENNKVPDLFAGGSLSRVLRTISTPGIAEPVIQARLKALDMTFQEYVASLIAYDCWAEKPHSMTGDACKVDRRSKRGKAEETRLWKEIITDYGKEGKTGSYFAHRVSDTVRKLLDGK